MTIATERWPFCVDDIFKLITNNMNDRSSNSNLYNIYNAHIAIMHQIITLLNNTGGLLFVECRDREVKRIFRFQTTNLFVDTKFALFVNYYLLM